MQIKLWKPISIYELGQRSNQEDAIYPIAGEATSDTRLYVLCDGMGGHERGEVASNTICEVLAQLLVPSTKLHAVITDEMLRGAVQVAIQRLDALEIGEEKRMGTTLTVLAFHAGGCTAAHIGDSRIYHLRPRTQEIRYKSRDHSLVYELFQCGELTYEEMKTSPRRNVITRAIQAKGEAVEADIVHITDIEPGDYFYLCSDGMLETMEDDELLSILSSRTTDEEKVRELTRRTAQNKDNHSAYLIQVAEVVKDDAVIAFEANEHTVPYNAALIEKRLCSVDTTTIGIPIEENSEVLRVSSMEAPHETAYSFTPIAPSESLPSERFTSKSFSNSDVTQETPINHKKRSLWLLLIIIFLAIIVTSAGAAYVLLDLGNRDEKQEDKVEREQKKSAKQEGKVKPIQPNNEYVKSQQTSNSVADNQETTGKELSNKGKKDDYREGNSENAQTREDGGTQTENHKGVSNTKMKSPMVVGETEIAPPPPAK